MPLQLEPYTLYQRVPHTPMIPKHLLGMKCHMVNQNYSTIIEKAMPPAKLSQIKIIMMHLVFCKSVAIASSLSLGMNNVDTKLYLAHY